jgi:Zn-dependent protease
MGSAPTLTQISVHPSWILWLSILVYFQASLVLPFLIAAALHEFGHYLVLRRMNKQPTRLTLSCSGIAMETPPLGYREELIAAAAGPLVSFLLGLVFPVAPLTALYSVCLGLFNLLPIPGLDGGRILTALLHMRFHPETADRLSCLVGLLSATTVCMISLILSIRFSLGLWPVLVSALFLLRAMQVWRL